jgi:hypothetical protein
MNTVDEPENDMSGTLNLSELHTTRTYGVM